MILFLDFDGVLHPDSAYLVKGRPTLKGEGELFMWAPLLVKTLADFPEVQIVLSTSWARELSFNRARRWLPEELRARVVGSTWHSAMSFKREGFRSLATWWDEATRYEQIKRYAGRAGLTDWVAIDDQPEGWGADNWASWCIPIATLGFQILSYWHCWRHAWKVLERQHDASFP